MLFYAVFLKRSLRQPPRHESSSLIGRRARTLAPLSPDGQIIVNGEIWLATSCTGRLIPSQRGVLIREVRGRLLLVEVCPDSEDPVTTQN
ncbi:NfeD family protein [Candidatus Bipolaricaulota bacterium]